jgi:hypothetical protein
LTGSQEVGGSSPLISTIKVSINTTKVYIITVRNVVDPRFVGLEKTDRALSEGVCGYVSEPKARRKTKSAHLPFSFLIK